MIVDILDTARGQRGPDQLRAWLFTSQIRTHLHDFGSYRELDQVFDPVDAVATAYAECVQDGFGRWSDGGMIVAVPYDEQYQGTMDVPSESAAATGAIVRLT